LKVVFSKHAEWKFEVLRRHGIIIEKKTVEEAVAKPDLLQPGLKEIMIAVKVLDDKHLIRVIHTKKDNHIRVITFYPIRREKYAGKI